MVRVGSSVDDRVQGLVKDQGQAFDLARRHPIRVKVGPMDSHTGIWSIVDEWTSRLQSTCEIQT